MMAVMEDATRTRRRAAAVLAALLPLLALATVVGLVERPIRPVAIAQGAVRAAVAIRDDVVPFQQWGSRDFTVPYLERGYDRVRYVTARRGSDGRAELRLAVEDAAHGAASLDVFLLAHGNDYAEALGGLSPEVRS